VYTRILVPLDGSGLAEQVLPYARLLGQRLDSRIELLRVFEPPSPDLNVGLNPAMYAHRTNEFVEQQAMDYLNGVAGDLRDAGIRVSTAVLHGSFAPHIVDEAENEPDTLIAMCSHGRSGLTRWLRGSVTDKILHVTKDPLLIVRAKSGPSRPAEANIKTIIVPLDGSALAEQILPHAGTIAVAMESQVILVTVTSDDVPDAAAADCLRRSAEKLRQAGVSSVEERVVRGAPAAEIVDLAHQVPDSLVAMTTYGRSGVGRWLMGSVADRVVRDSESPVLVIRAA